MVNDDNEPTAPSRPTEKPKPKLIFACSVCSWKTRNKNAKCPRHTSARLNIWPKRK